MEGSASEGEVGGRPLPARLPPSVQGRTTSLPEGKVLADRRRGAMDLKPGGDGDGTSRRAGRLESKGLSIACSTRSTCRGKGCEGGLLNQQGESKRKEEEEKVRKETQEGEGQSSRDEAYQSLVREDRARSGTISEEEAVEECKKGGLQEKPEVKFFKQFFVKHRGVESRGGRGLRDLRARGKSACSLESSSWMSDAGDVRSHAEGVGAADGATLGFRSGVPPASVHAVLEDSTRSPSVKTDVEGDADVIFLGGLATPRQGSCGMRCGDSKIEVPGADFHGGRLQSLPEAGAGACRGGEYVISGRNLGGLQATEGGSQSESCRRKRLGTKIWKGGVRLLGCQSERKEGRVRQGQRKGKQGRWQEGRRKEARGGEGEEMSGKLDGEKAVDTSMVVEDAVSLSVEPGVQGRWFVPSHTPPVLEESAKNSLDLFASKTDGSGAEVMQDCVAEEATRCGPPMSSFLAEGAGLVKLRSALKEGLSGFRFHELSQLLCECFDEILEKCELKHCKVQRSGGVVPLPETLFGLTLCLPQELFPREPFCLLAICKALNSYYGVAWKDHTAITAAKRSSVEALASFAVDAIQWKEKVDDVSWADLMSTRSVDYKGEEVRVSLQFRWENIKDALPDEVGRIALEEVCELGTRDFVVNFEEYLLPPEAQVYTKPPRVMVDEGSWEQICSGLLSKGICTLLPVADLFHVGGQPVLNGLFGVSKEEFSGGWEVMRLIMNLIPVNRLCRNLGGDVSTLPSWSGMNPFLLKPSEVMLMSSEDIRCFFYLFAVPSSWHRYLGFNKLVPPGLVPGRFAGMPCVLVSRVLPMGFVNSVAIAQHVHRRIARLGLRGGLSPVGGHQEIRRDKALPSSSTSYRIYLDNFDLLEKVDGDLAALIKGEVPDSVEGLRQAYQELGLPRHPKKTVVREPVAEIQGAIVDGSLGKVMAKPAKVLKYFSLGLQLLNQGSASQKQLQILCGGFVYCTMFRRPLLGLLNVVWKHILSFEGEPPVVRKPLPDLVKLELCRFLCALPLAKMNLRVSLLGGVTASDASETGGGFCVSRGLTPMGVHASHCCIRGDVPEIEDHIQVLTVGLFDGIGALRVCADALLLPMAGHISSEVSPEGNRVVEAHFPEALVVGSVESIDEEMVTSWACRFSSVGVVVVGGGPPCQGVSGLNSDRKGALRDARSSLFPHVRRVFGLCRRKFTWAQVHYLMESVASMDAKDRELMSQDIGVLPWKIDSAGIALCHRPRLYWISWDLEPGEGIAIHPPEGDSWAGFGTIELTAEVDAAQFLHSQAELHPNGRLPTFTTSRPRAHPGNRPAGLWQCEDHERQRWVNDEHRYPPYQYRDKNLVWSREGPRLPTIAEKEVIMGFPLHFTSHALPKSRQSGVGYLDVRHSLIGNSWNVQVVTWLLSNLFGRLGLTSVTSVAQVVSHTSPGRDDSLRAYLQRLPLTPPKGKSGCEHEAILADKLSSFVSIKGEDILLQAPSEQLVRFQRLRASIPARLWRWRVVAGWRWKFREAHINELELRAVLTTLLWRLERRRQKHCKFIHLVDSLVVLHALSRGRSSSRKLRRPLSQINSLLLAVDAHPVWACVSTKQNPADRPSRLKVKKHASKKG